jgi:hypothetical protein
MPEYTKLEVVEIAKKQKAVVWMFVITGILLCSWIYSIAEKWAFIPVMILSDLTRSEQALRAERERMEKVRELIEKQPEVLRELSLYDRQPKSGPAYWRSFLKPDYALIVVSVISLIFTYRLAKALKLRYAWLSCVPIVIPPMSLVVMLLINGKAVSVLRDQGIAVTHLGVKKAELEKLAVSQHNTR